MYIYLNTSCGTRHRQSAHLESANSVAKPYLFIFLIFRHVLSFFLYLPSNDANISPFVIAAGFLLRAVFVTFTGWSTLGVVETVDELAAVKFR